MFRSMRRARQQLSEQESVEILERGTSGVLALLGEDGYPYAVPISYALDGRRLFFHRARRPWRPSTGWRSGTTPRIWARGGLGRSKSPGTPCVCWPWRSST